MISIVREIGETKNNARNFITVYHDERFKFFKNAFGICTLVDVLKDFFEKVLEKDSVLRLTYDTEYNMLGVTTGNSHLKPGGTQILVAKVDGIGFGFPEIKYFEETQDGYVPRDEFIAEVLKYIMTGEEGWDYIFKDGEEVTEEFVLERVSNKVELREPLKFIKFVGDEDSYNEIKNAIDALNKESDVDFEYSFGRVSYSEACLVYKQDANVLRKWHLIDTAYVVYSDKEIVSVVSEEDFSELFKKVI